MPLRSSARRRLPATLAECTQSTVPTPDVRFKHYGNEHAGNLGYKPPNSSVRHRLLHTRSVRRCPVTSHIGIRGGLTHAWRAQQRPRWLAGLKRHGFMEAIQSVTAV